MGSLEAACIAGFLCRLCSEIHRTVIHIYSDQGLKHGLAKKINDYLPVTVSILLHKTPRGRDINSKMHLFLFPLKITPSDPLPKTICETCMMRVEQHHDLMLKVARPRLSATRNSKTTATARSSTSTSTYASGEANKRSADDSSATNETSRDNGNVVVCDDHQIYNDSGISNSNSSVETNSTYDL